MYNIFIKSRVEFLNEFSSLQKNLHLANGAAQLSSRLQKSLHLDVL
jgi:hypothetical protein